MMQGLQQLGLESIKYNVDIYTNCSN